MQNLNALKTFSDGHCTAQQDLSDAQKVADKLGVKLHTVNFSSDYWDDVFEHFLQEHKKGPIKQMPVESFLLAVTKPFSVAIFRTSSLLISPKGNRLFESWCWFKRCRK
jgi:hypothetical protein